MKNSSRIQLFDVYIYIFFKIAIPNATQKKLLKIIQQSKFRQNWFKIPNIAILSIHHPDHRRRTIGGTSIDD